MMKNIEKKVFPDQEAFERKYDEYLNLDTMAPGRIMEAYGEIGDAIEKYIEQLSEWEFRIMYVMGYMDALKDNNIKGGNLMNIPEEIRISKYQSTVFLEGTELKELYDAIRKYWGFDEYNSGAFTASVFYNLGRVHGIREERARRKK